MSVQETVDFEDASSVGVPSATTPDNHPHSYILTHSQHKGLTGYGARKASLLPIQQLPTRRTQCVPTISSEVVSIPTIPSSQGYLLLSAEAEWCTQPQEQKNTR